MNMRSQSLRGKAILAISALIFGTLSIVGITPAKAIEGCPTGYTLNGTTCTLVTTYTASMGLNVDVLIIGGGGGGGALDMGGGGGGGGVFYQNSVSVSSAQSIVVGSGGAAGSNGNNSSFGALTQAIGGGAGGSSGVSGNAGGSGGGAGRNNFTGGVSNQTNTNGTKYGFNGGVAAGNGTYDLAGSGAGAGAIGTGRTNADSRANNNGGVGTDVFSSWAVVTSTGQGGYYAGGGGVGGYFYTPTGSARGSFGGLGGGGAGADVPASGTHDMSAGTAGVANTGGGGGGGSAFNGSGGSGGSGIVIVRYSGVTNKAVGGTISTGSNFTFHTFLANGAFTPTTGTPTCAGQDTLSGTTCTNTITLNTTTQVRCPSGSYEDPNDLTKCILNGGSISAGSTVVPTYSCPSGYALTFITGVTVPICQTAGTTYLASVTTTKSCPSGGTLVNNDCVTASTYISQNYTATTTTTRTCPNGGTLGGDTCYVAGGTVVRAYQGTSYGTPTGYSCSGQDFLAGTTCYTSGGTLLNSYTATTTLTWACPSGYFPYFSECWNGYQTASHYYITNVTCPSGGTLSGTTCNVYSVSTNYPASITYTTSYYCPEGGDISGTTCTVYAQPTSYLATVQAGTSSCPNGGTLNGTTCINGYTQSGQTYTAIVNTAYSCPSGGTLTNLNCVYATTTITIIIKYSGTCPTNYKFNTETLLCDPVPYPYVGGVAISLAGVYLCLTYSYGNLIETKYYTYDATNSTVLGSLFERKCVLESGLEANVSSESGFYYCEIINKVTQEMSTILSPTDITGFRTNRSTTCILIDDVEEPSIEVYTFEYNQQLIDTCATIDSVQADFAIWIACQILRNA